MKGVKDSSVYKVIQMGAERDTFFVLVKEMVDGLMGENKKLMDKNQKLTQDLQAVGYNPRHPLDMD